MEYPSNKMNEISNRGIGSLLKIFTMYRVFWGSSMGWLVFRFDKITHDFMPIKKPKINLIHPIYGLKI